MRGTTDHFRDDSRFIGQMMDELQAKFRVDARRIYLVGFSNGGGWPPVPRWSWVTGWPPW